MHNHNHDNERVMDFIFVALLVIFVILIIIAGLIERTLDKNDIISAEIVEEQLTDNYQDIELMSKIVWLEAGTCSEDCQRCVASVIFNQYKAGYWGTSIADVLSYPGNYSSYKYLDRAKFVPESVKDICKDVIENGSYLPEYVRYFRASHDFEWDGYKPYINFDNVFFGYFEEWEKGVH